MTQSPEEILTEAYNAAQVQPIEAILAALPDDCVQDLRTIVQYAEKLKGVLGVTLTSITYKIYKPSQDVRYHQENMPHGYSGRSFDTRYVTPFLKNRFPHFAMAESAWLTRSLEQPRPYDYDYPGKIKDKDTKLAFLNTLNRLQQLQKDGEFAQKMLVGLLALMIEAYAQDDVLFNDIDVSDDVTIATIVEAVSQHIHFNYQGVAGTARIPVLAIYSVYTLLRADVKRYSDKVLSPLELHTSPDSRSKALGDIEIKNSDGSCFEAIEVKHMKPVSTDMIDVAYRKLKDTQVDRYYILTTSEPNMDNPKAVIEKIAAYRKVHACQIIVNGVIPSLKYYLRLVSNPQAFVGIYTQNLEYEYQRASGIKGDHLRVWQEIRRQILKVD